MLKALLASILLLGVFASPAPAANLHRGKAGVYMRVSNDEQHNPGLRDVALANPNLDCVILSAFWADLEPQKGHFEFSKLHRNIDEWTATGKHVAIHLALYGQSTDDRFTPPWVYDQKDIRSVTFEGGGMARGEMVRIPIVWDAGFVEKYGVPLAKALAKEFDGDARIWYIHPPIGHIGNLTAQPAKTGAAPLVQAGWTVDKWKAYSLAMERTYRSSFKKIPLLMLSSPILLRNRKRDNYAAESFALCETMANEGDAIDFFNLQADRSELGAMYASAQKIAIPARKGLCRLGMGDDWPLWAPEQRRKKSPTVGFDDAYFQKTLNNAFSTGTAPLPTTMLYLCAPEILASSPISPGRMAGKEAACFYRKSVADILQAARKQLFANDAKCFGSK